MNHKIENIINTFHRIYPDAASNLKYYTPFQLLIATMLSAQSTDSQVNKITTELFEKYSSPADFAELEPETLEKEIRGCGLYRTKSKNIIRTSKILREKYDNQVPDDFESLIGLPGVGNKTANVVLSNAFNKDAIAVDTHVFRVANRLGLANASSPEKTQKQLEKALPQDVWSKAHHWLIFHGRSVCRAQSPDCESCSLNRWCSRYLS